MNEIERWIEHIKTQDAFYLSDGCMDAESIERMRERRNCMYNGLTIADKPELEDAKKRGIGWIVRDKTGVAWGCDIRPTRTGDEEPYWDQRNGICIVFGHDSFEFVNSDDDEPIYIPTALAQIAEMERKTVTRTNQDALLERYKNVDLFAVDIAAESYVDDYGMYFLPDGSKAYSEKEVADLAKKWLLSPYTEGATT